MSRIQFRTSGNVGNGFVPRRRSNWRNVDASRDHRMMVPSSVTASFEMIEAEFVLQLPIVLFDGPTGACEADELAERRGGRQVQQIGFALAAGGERTLRQEPALGPTRGGGRTRRAAKRAANGPFVPCAHATRRHARRGSCLITRPILYRRRAPVTCTVKREATPRAYRKPMRSTAVRNAWTLP